MPSSKAFKQIKENLEVPALLNGKSIFRYTFFLKSNLIGTRISRSWRNFQKGWKLKSNNQVVLFHYIFNQYLPRCEEEAIE